jgi:hypothetical protein
MLAQVGEDLELKVFAFLIPASNLNVFSTTLFTLKETIKYQSLQLMDYPYLLAYFVRQ